MSVVDLNAARKARAGNTDTGLCACGKYFRLFCRNLCMSALVDAVTESEPLTTAEVLANVRSRGIDPGHDTDRVPGDPPDDVELEWLDTPADGWGVATEDDIADHLADMAYKRWREGD